MAVAAREVAGFTDNVIRIACNSMTKFHHKSKIDVHVYSA